ncbi:SIMPL domain-containing protein [Microbacterium deminutum]|uniref:SIMPL domain-containing protein n=1 Tax=Microbacterium deminutum TaxID=344164 RepID=A0ABN2QWQ0_9MICO
MSEVVITVRGEHETRIAPEEGVVRLSVRTEGPDRGEVVERMSSLAAPLRDDLETRKDSGVVTEWSSQHVSVWANRPWNSEGKQLALVQYASVEITATFADFASLSWWVSDVAERDGIQVDGVEWRLTPATAKRIEAEVASQAVKVAVERATAYAGAVGLASISPLEIADVGLLDHRDSAGGPPEMMRMAKASFAMDAGGAAPSVQLEPEDIVVTAGVEARFVAR